MTALSLRQLAYALGGDVAGRHVVAPGPGHSRKDRSLSVRLSLDAPGGFIVHSHAGDDFGACRDYVAARLGLAPGEHIPAVPPEKDGGRPDFGRLARRTWEAAVDARGTIAEAYLASRGLSLPPDAGEAIRFHPQCAWREDDRTIFVPAMVCAMHAIVGNTIVAVHRTRLTEDGRKVDRRILGPALGAALKIDADENVTYGLTIGEGVETCLAARQFGFKPVWAVANAGGIALFPLLAGIDALTILEENDERGASQRAVQTCGDRWHAAGREVLVVRSRHGSDVNDAWRAAA